MTSDCEDISHSFSMMVKGGGRFSIEMSIILTLKYFHHLDMFTINGRQPTKKLTKGLTLPGTSDYAAYVKLIEELPENSTSAIGLPENVDRALQQTSSAAVIEQLKILRQVDVQQLRFDKQKWIKELSPFLQVWKKLNTGVDILNKKVTQSADSDPLLSFLNLVYKRREKREKALI